ncbi:PREDICTED: periphilin-1 isoform X2 [Chinchilla lanigera]|uniref:periphilin-1 isoform X2 n=1 Tax=Chinchilla lanigera TaxID=34839 RepID=UPI000696A5D9|nr:PREDICTED: periphilin-1 isoform X2 [Chinchilla lanigera]
MFAGGGFQAVPKLRPSLRSFPRAGTVGAQQSPPAYPLRGEALWLRGRYVEGKEGTREPRSPQPLLARENSSASKKKNERATETKKEKEAQVTAAAVVVGEVAAPEVAAVPPIIAEQQTGDIKKSMEESVVPTPAPAVQGDRTVQLKDEPREGLLVVSSGAASAEVKGKPGEGLSEMNRGPQSTQAKVAERRNEMWSEGRYDYDRLPRERVPPRSHPTDGYHRVVNVPKKPPLLEKKPPLLEKKPPLLEKKPPLLDRPGEGGYSRYYSHVGYRDYDEGRIFSHDRRSGPPHRGDESGYRWSRDDHSASRQSDYRDVRDGFRRKSFYSSHYTRDRSPHTRDPPFFRDSPVGRKDSPHSRSGSSVSSRSYSPDRNKTYSFHQSQHRNKERPVQSLKTSRDTSPSSSPAGPSPKALEKPSRLTEKELAEAASKWAAEKLEKSEESSVPGISEFQVQSGFQQRPCIPAVWNQAGNSPLLELPKLAIQLPPGANSETQSMDPLPSTTRTSGPTWGDIKKITYQAEQTLKMTGTPFTPENLFLSMIEQITSSSKAAKAGPTTPLFIEQPEEPETNATNSTELFEDSQLSSRSKAIALKTKEIEQVYRQDCETFGMVVKMLIEKDPSLEKSIQFALRQNLHEIGERCVEELKHFIAEYDASAQDFGEPF